MVCIFLNLALLFSSCGGIKNDTLPQSIKEIWIYDYFHVIGYTTAGAYGQIIRLEEERVPKFKLEQNDTDSLCRIIQESSTFQFFHNKWPAGGTILVEIVLKNGQKIMCFIVSGAISVDVYKKNYWVKDERNLEWLVDFINRVRDGYGAARWATGIDNMIYDMHGRNASRYLKYRQ